MTLLHRLVLMMIQKISKKENEILRHELKIIELKWSLKTGGNKSEPNLKFENVDLRSQLS